MAHFLAQIYMCKYVFTLIPFSLDYITSNAGLTKLSNCEYCEMVEGNIMRVLAKQEDVVSLQVSMSCSVASCIGYLELYCCKKLHNLCVRIFQIFLFVVEYFPLYFEYQHFHCQYSNS
jgi:hypothetical protein